MKVMIQNADTRLLFSTTGQWTPTPTDARDFPFSFVAYQFAEAHGLENFNILFHYLEIDYAIEILSKSSLRHA